MVPIGPSTLHPMSDDMTKDPGVWARQILANPKLIHGKYAAGYNEVIMLEDPLSQWAAVSGKQGVYMEVKPEVTGNLYGLAGHEAVTEVLLGEAGPD